MQQAIIRESSPHLTVVPEYPGQACDLIRADMTRQKIEQRRRDVAAGTVRGQRQQCNRCMCSLQERGIGGLAPLGTGYLCTRCAAMRATYQAMQRGER